MEFKPIHEELLKTKLVVMGAVVNEEAFCLKWNDFHTSLTSTFTELRAESDLLGPVHLFKFLGVG